MKTLFDKLKGTKAALRCYRECVELLEAQNTELKDFDDKWLIESKDFKWSFPITARAIKRMQLKLIVLEPQKAQVFCGINADYINREYCEKNDIEIVPFPTQGGAAVCNKGDILLIFMIPKKKGRFRFLEAIKPQIIKYLSEHINGSSIATSGNDIEVNGKKLSGSSTALKMGVVIESIFISGVNNQNNLDAVGHKGRKRAITSITELGINLKDFREWIVKTIQNEVDKWTQD